MRLFKLTATSSSKWIFQFDLTFYSTFSQSNVHFTIQCLSVILNLLVKVVEIIVTSIFHPSQQLIFFFYHDFRVCYIDRQCIFVFLDRNFMLGDSSSFEIYYEVIFDDIICVWLLQRFLLSKKCRKCSHLNLFSQNYNKKLMQGTSNNQVYSVLAGFPVTYSSRYANPDCQLWRLDAEKYAWSPAVNNQQQWIQVSSIKPETWIGIVTQGRPNYDQRVTQYRVSYTMNGIDWQYVDGGRLFVGNNDSNLKVRNNFQNSVVARSIRIHPTRWHNHISIRFDAILIEA